MGEKSLNLTRLVIFSGTILFSIVLYYLSPLAFGFMASMTIILYIFREKKEKMPQDVTYSAEGSLSSLEVDNQLEHNAYLHSLAPSTGGVMYGIHNDRRKKPKRGN
jgi:ABC-type multidrug transport system permease subunit